MSNPLFNAMGGGQFGNMTNMVRQFQQFKRTFQGNPQQQIQTMLNTGQVSQEQYNRAVQMAKSLQEILNG